MPELNLKPHAAKVRDYYAALHELGQLHISHEMAVRKAFSDLLTSCAKPLHWSLVHELSLPVPNNRRVVVDGAFISEFAQKMGFWEAKDLSDNLEREIKRKFEQGYPRDNIIFQTPERAILYQKGMRQGLNEDITRPDNLVELLKHFFAYRAPHHEDWEQAVAAFKDRIPEIAAAVTAIIEKERKTNRNFVAAFESFVELCRQAINPNLSDEAVEKMLVQHLLTERIFRKVFQNPEFTRRNIIAAEIEKVIDSLTSKHFSRDAFLQDLDRFYRAIEVNAENATDYSEKQSFLNTVYERFFQGFSKKEADTHGIVYTPQPIVNFMVRSVEEILQKEFGKSLSSEGVHILDPFVGTGNFIVRVMKEIKKTALPYKYANELHCNEVMLLPYYIASMNIEHAYLDATGEYKPFEGICLVDTFELAEGEQSALFTAENTQRVERQKKAPIFVIIGNPPYNMGQVNENDENRNRAYPHIDSRVRETYSRASKATLKNKLSDPYAKAFRWATDRLGEEGLIAFVSNNSFLDQLAFDGMRRHLQNEFTSIYVLDLGGNVRKNPKLSGTTHNVFGIQVGVAITFLVRTRSNQSRNIYYSNMQADWRKEQKYCQLDEWQESSTAPWRELLPDANGNWLVESESPEFATFMPIGQKQEKHAADVRSIFALFSLGVATNRDAWVYSSNRQALEAQVRALIRNYSAELARFRAARESRESFDIRPDDRLLKWTDRLKDALVNGTELRFIKDEVRHAAYRPFDRRFVYFDHILNQRRYQQHRMFPSPLSEEENVAIALNASPENSIPYCLTTKVIPDLHFTGDSQCFPFYTYAEDGSNRRENITDWGLEQFRSHYNDRSITKWDIFYYTYAVLHHPEYRSRYAANLKRELPRIPYVTASEAEANASSGESAGTIDAAVPEGRQNVAHHGAKQSGGSTTAKRNGGTETARSASSLPQADAAAPQDGGEASSERAQRLKPTATTGLTARLEAVPLPNTGAGSRALPNADAALFHAFAAAGRQLAELHINYESQEPYDLEQVENPKEKRNLRVEKMRLSKDKTTLVYNDFLTLKGIPREAFEYRLGNRSALEWVIDQYQVSTDKRSGITNDPNRADDETYILRLVGQVITVSLETMKIVNALPGLGLAEKAEVATAND